MNKEKIVTGVTSVIIFFIILSVYFYNICPTVLGYQHDSVNLLVAAATYGIPHAFYPLFIFFGYLFSKIPIGEVALRLNLMSSFFAAATSLVIFYTIMFALNEFEKSDYKIKLISATVTAFLFAFFEKIWLQAEYLENHISLTFFVGLFIYSFFILKRNKTVKSFYFLSFCSGLLIMINPNAAPFFLPFFILHLLAFFKKINFSIKNYLIGFLFFLIPFLTLIPFIYQIKNAQYNYIETFAPGVSRSFWEIHDFSSVFWRAFWLYSGRDRTVLFNERVSLIPPKFNLYVFSPLLINIGLIGLILLIIGFDMSFKKDKKMTLVLFWTVLFWLYTIFSTNYGEHQDEHLLIIWVIIFFWLGLGIYRWFNIFWQKRLIREKNLKIALVIISFLPISLIIKAYKLNYLKTNFNRCITSRVERYEVIRNYPKNIALATHWGSPTVYYLMIEKLRPDIKIFPGYANLRSRINQLKKRYGKNLIIEKTWTMEEW